MAASLVNQQLVVYPVALVILLSYSVLIIVIHHVVVLIFLQSSVVSLKHNTSLSIYSLLNHKSSLY